MVSTPTLVGRTGGGFTLVELLVVMAALALLLSIAAPRYIEHVDRARESVLRTNLAAIRDALDKFQVDRGRYPDKLQELVDAHYLRVVPQDPYLERADAWQLVAPAGGATGGIADVRSSAPGKARDGSTYASW